MCDKCNSHDHTTEECSGGMSTAAFAGYAPFETPFRFEPLGPAVFDHFGHRVLDLRGWGFLTGKGTGAKGLPEETAANIQNGIGSRLAALMNKDAEGRILVPLDRRTGKPLVTTAMKADCDKLRAVFKEAEMVVEADGHYQNSIRNMTGDRQRAEEDLFANLVRLGNAVKAYRKTLEC